MEIKDKNSANSNDTSKEKRDTDKPKEKNRNILQESIKRYMSDVPGEGQK